MALTRHSVPLSLLGLGVAAGFLFTGTLKADEKDKPKGKKESPRVVQDDLSQLPPDLAKQLQAYLLKLSTFGLGA